jgi:hypothetical protein
VADVTEMMLLQATVVLAGDYVGSTVDTNERKQNVTEVNVQKIAVIFFLFIHMT